MLSRRLCAQYTASHQSIQMIIEDIGDTNAHQAVIATKPPRVQLRVIPAWGLPLIKNELIIAVIHQAAAARVVLSAIRPTVIAFSQSIAS